MKSVVVEIRCGIAAVLSDDGCIVKVKNQNFAIGQVIEMKETTKRKIHFPSAVAVATVALFMCGMVGISAYAYYTPYSYVSLDVNPSIEYSLNRFDRVLKVSGVNEDGKEIVKELDLDSLSNKKIDEVLTLTIKQIEEEGFFDGNEEGGIVISTSAKDLKKADVLAKELKQSTEDATEEENVKVESFPVGLERVQEAHKLGVTPGKLNLVEKLRDSTNTPDDVDMDEWLSKPVKEIMREIKENKIESKTANQAEKNTDSTGSTSQTATKAAAKTEDLNDSATQDQSTSETDETETQDKQNGNLNKQVKQDKQDQNGKSDKKS